MITKLVAVEFTVEEGDKIEHKVGDKYICLQDPDTGKYYEPIPGWEVTGEDLTELFREIQTQDT